MQTNNMTSEPHKQLKLKKSLRWAPACSEYSSIGHINDMSKQEICRLWYNKKDYNTFRKDCRNTASLLKNKRKAQNFEFIKKNILCERGIEHRMSKTIYDRQCKQIQTAISVVLEEQADQRRFGTFSIEFIAELYQQCSVQCQKEAQRRGLKDEKEVYRFHNREAKREEIEQTSPKTSTPLFHAINEQFTTKCHSSKRKNSPPRRQQWKSHTLNARF